GGESHSLLDLLEAWPPVLVEGHDLAVENDLLRTKCPADRMHLLVARGDVFTASAHQANGTAFHIRLSADAVPFELEAPRVVRRWRFVHELGHHRLHALGQRLAL